jgi:hypothetical protein
MENRSRFLQDQLKQAVLSAQCLALQHGCLALGGGHKKTTAAKAVASCGDAVLFVPPSRCHHLCSLLDNKKAPSENEGRVLLTLAAQLPANDLWRA